MRASGEAAVSETATNDLKRLSDAGLLVLVPHGERRGRHYRAGATVVAWLVLMGAALMVVVAWLGWRLLGAGGPAALSAGVAGSTTIAALVPVALLSFLVIALGCFVLAVAAVRVLVDAARLPNDSWFDRGGV